MDRYFEYDLRSVTNNQRQVVIPYYLGSKQDDGTIYYDGEYWTIYDIIE